VIWQLEEYGSFQVATLKVAGSGFGIVIFSKQQP
jgi:hypothetical protein